MERQVFTGPFKATKLWNEIVNSFRSEISLSRHRRHMRSYDNCFVACDAVDWLHRYLNRDPNFAFKVSRNQTVQLLGKFLQSRIFEDVRTTNSSPSSSIASSNQFKDNRDLYRFPRKSPVKVTVGIRSPIVRTPLKARTNTNLVVTDKKRGKPTGGSFSIETKVSKLPGCRVTVTTRPPTVNEIEQIWKEALLSRLRQLLTDRMIVDDLLSGVDVNSKYIIHNSTRIGRTGIVESLDRSKELPHWILSAMKCLVAWPKASGMESCLPNYPGFERDVFRVVQDYFGNLEEPLTTFAMYNVLVSVYVLGEEMDSCGQTFSKVERCANPSSSRPMDDLVNQLSRATMIEAETGIQTTSTPLGHSCPNLSKLKNEHTSLMACNSEVVLPSVCFETVFLTENPVTRIIAEPGEDFLSARSRTTSAFCVGSQTKELNVEMKSPRCKSVASLNVAQKRNFDYNVREAKVVNANTFVQRTIAQTKQETREESSVLNVLLNESGGYLNLAYNENLDCSSVVDPQLRNFGGYVNLACTEHSRCSSSYNGDDDVELGRPVSYVSEDSGSYHSACSQPSNKSVRNDYFATSNRPLRRSVSSSSVMLEVIPRIKETLDSSKTVGHSIGSQYWTWNPPDKCLRHIDSTLSDSNPPSITEEGKCLVIEAMQLCLLLLPPDVRRNLHRLLKFMAMVVDNKHLRLDGNQSNRSILLMTFSRSLLSPKHEADYNELLAAKIVTFVLDNYDAIFNVPSSLVARVESSFVPLANTKIRYAEDDDEDCTGLTYCKQVTAEEYERRKCAASEKAIADLLDSIVIDPNISAQEKKRRLKQFKKVYPEIYGRKFPNEPVKKKQTAIYKKPLQKLLEMRL